MLYAPFVRFRAIFGVLALCLFLVACALVPQREFGAYARAFDEAREASRLIYASLEPAFERISPRLDAEGAGRPAAATPAPFVGALGSTWSRAAGEACGGLSKYRDLEVRCQAFELAAIYNETISELVAGAGPEAVRGQLELFSGLLGPVGGSLASALATPVANLGFGALENIVQRALTYKRNREILVELREGAPIMRQLVSLLRKDTPNVHALQRAYYVLILGDIVDDRLQPAAAEFRQAHSLLKRPSDEAKRARFDELERRYTSAVGSLMRHAEIKHALGSAELPRDGGSLPFSGDFEAGMLRMLEVIEDARDAFEETSEDWRRFDESLRKYDSMLQTTENALTALESATPGVGQASFSFGALVSYFAPWAPKEPIDMTSFALAIGQKANAIKLLLQ